MEEHKLQICTGEFSFKKLHKVAENYGKTVFFFLFEHIEILLNRHLKEFRIAGGGRRFSCVLYLQDLSLRP